MYTFHVCPMHLSMSPEDRFFFMLKKFYKLTKIKMFSSKSITRKTPNFRTRQISKPETKILNIGHLKKRPTNNTKTAKIFLLEIQLIKEIESQLR